MKSHQPAIVVAAYNRIESLKRILRSIETAEYLSPCIPLILSIDQSSNRDVIKLARDFQWKYGEKTVIEHPKNLGLRQHILQCGDLTEKYGSIILLEDDLYVSPHFYQYAQDTSHFYAQEPRVAGISLYAHRYNETAFMRFTPVQDAHDAYLMQIPSSWGQVWTRDQWSAFRMWYAKHGADRITSTAEVPPNVLLWPETSWKKYYFKYIIEKDLYFVYPYVSLTTNFADLGTHHTDNRTWLQLPLQRFQVQYRLPTVQDASIVYDSYCELSEKSFKRLCKNFSSYDVEIDLHGQKDLAQVKKRYLLTSKKISGPALMSYGRQFKPHEMNMVYENAGSIFHLVNREHAVMEPFVLIDSTRNSYYYSIREEFLLKTDR